MSSMKKRRNHITAGIIITSIVLIITVLIIIVNCYLSDYLNIFELNWNRSIPKEVGLTEVYAADSGASFHGDGIRYHVYSYRQEEPVHQSFNRKEEDIEPDFYESLTDAAEDWLDSINIPEEKRPAYNECYYTYFVQDDNSELIIFWNRIIQKIYIVESFQ